MFVHTVSAELQFSFSVSSTGIKKKNTVQTKHCVDPFNPRLFSTSSIQLFIKHFSDPVFFFYKKIYHKSTLKSAQKKKHCLFHIRVALYSSFSLIQLGCLSGWLLSLWNLTLSSFSKRLPQCSQVQLKCASDVCFLMCQLSDARCRH